MSKKDWVDPHDIEVFQPASGEELEARKDDLKLIYGAEYDESMWNWAAKYFPSFWIFYYDAQPVGLIRRDFFKRSVEMHGHVREGYFGRGIQYYAVLANLNHTFFIVPRTKNKRGYDRVVIAVPNGNEQILGFARSWAFEKTDHREGEVTYWRLTRERFVRTSTKNEQQQSPESESSPGH